MACIESTLHVVEHRCILWKLRCIFIVVFPKSEPRLVFCDRLAGALDLSRGSSLALPLLIPCTARHTVHGPGPEGRAGQPVLARVTRLDAFLWASVCEWCVVLCLDQQELSDLSE